MNVKRILVFVLAMMVMAMPIGLAEGGYGALTLSNFHVDIAGMEEPLDIDAALTVGVGAQDDGAGRLDVALSGGGQSAFSASVGLDKDAVRALVDGTSYVFEVPMPELEQMMAAVAEMGGGVPNVSAADLDKLKGFAAGFLNIVKKYSDPQNAMKNAAPALAALDAEAKGKEQVELFGETMELNRFDIAMTGADIGKLCDAMFQADPDLKAFVTELLNMAEEQSGEKLPIDLDDISGIIQSGLDEAGIGLEMDVSLWVDTETLGDANAKAIKKSVTMTVTNLKATEDSDVKSVSFPVEAAFLVSDAGTKVSMNTTIAPEGSEGSMDVSFDGTLQAPADNGGTTSDAAMTFSFDSTNDDEDFDVNVSFNKTKDADGVVDLTSAFSGMGSGQQFDLTFGYDGQTATEAEKAGTVTLDFNLPSEGVSGTFSCDTLFESSAFAALNEADYADKTKIDPITASEDDMTQIQTELYGVMMQAMGVLMQTPGLSDIMGSMMSSGMAG